MAELKPCPFCGGEAMVYTQTGRYRNFAYIKCDTCSAQSKVDSTAYEYDDEDFFECNAYKTVVRAWNRRSAAKEILRGRWIQKVEDGMYFHECSLCGGEVTYTHCGFEMFSTYCPNCGAKMDGDGNG